MEIAGRRVRRFGRDHRISGSTNSLLPLRSTSYDDPPTTASTYSCCYCDYKIYALNDPIFRLGRRYAAAFRLWFSIGLGFGLAALILVSAALLLHVHPDSFSDRLAAAVFGFSSRFSLSGVAYVFVSTVMSVSVHELGHALAAASEGIRLEYIAIFIAGLFPGALVAFDHDVLQALPRSTSLRVYCAGIWHNAVFCAVCALTLFILPSILFPFYIHGEGPMVLNVPSTSPLHGYLSAGDVIMSLDGIRVHNPKEWLELAALLDKHSLQSSNSSLHPASSRRVLHRKGYCVPDSIIEESNGIPMVENQLVCPSNLTAFVPFGCLDAIDSHNNNGEDGQLNRRESAFCLNANDIVKLNKCGDGWVTSNANGSGCTCSKGESCLSPLQFPGLTWTEITYIRTTSSDCLKFSRNGFADSNTSKSIEHDCVETDVFVGDLIAMAHSVHSTAYQPRWVFAFGACLPDMLERFLTCTFHVSLTLVLLNSLPVYFLDGESILEVSLQYSTWLSPRRRKKALQISLLGGTIISILVFLRIFLIGFL